MAAKPKDSWKPGDKPRIYITRNGEAYVKPEEVVASKKFQEQVKKMAKIRISRRMAKIRRRQTSQK